jgi:hypothetical protein
VELELELEVQVEVNVDGDSYRPDTGSAIRLSEFPLLFYDRDRLRRSAGSLLDRSPVLHRSSGRR